MFGTPAGDTRGVRMATKVLAELIAEALRTQRTVSLTPEQQQKFHMEFEAELSPVVERIRGEERRAYEETQDLAFW